MTKTHDKKYTLLFHPYLIVNVPLLLASDTHARSLPHYKIGLCSNVVQASLEHISGLEYSREEYPVNLFFERSQNNSTVPE